MNKIVLSLIFTFTSSLLYAQRWQELILNGERNFETIQAAFYTEWDGKTIERGSGYKQFKRWEDRMEPRLIDGHVPNIAAAYFDRIQEESLMRARTETISHTWQSIGPNSWVNGPNGYNPGLGRVNCIDIDPSNPNTLFVGTPAGGLWKSINGGMSWNPMFEDLPVLGVTDFYIDPLNRNKMYVLTGDAYGADTYSTGVFKSIDGGVTWSNNSNFSPGVSSGYRMFRMKVDPTNSDRILIGGNGGIRLSTNGGTTWTEVLDEVVVDLEFKPNDPSVVYASTWGSSTFYKSINGGLDWTPITTPLVGLGRTAIGVSTDNSSYVYLLASAANSTFGGVYRSTDSGGSFSMMSDSPNIFGYSNLADDDRGQGGYDLAIAVNPNDVNDIYVSGIHIWNSKDGGATWKNDFDEFGILNYWVYDEQNTDNYVHADNHTLDFLNGKLYAGCDGGIWVTDNLGASWTDLSAGLNISQFYRLGLDPNNANRIVGGTQDNGSNLLENGTWNHLFGADGMEAIIDPTNGSTVYTSYQFGGIVKYSDKFVTAYITDALIEDNGLSGGWITPYVLDPLNSEHIYVGLEDVWKSIDGGSNWEQLSDFQSTATMRSLVVSKANTNYLYAASGFSIYRSSDAGVNWTQINAGLPNQYMTYIAVSEDDPLKVWVTFSGYESVQKVYKSIDGGATWSNVSSGLPNIPANCIIHQKGSNDQLYVGTDIGVYEMDNASGTWQPWFNGLPNVIVNELEIHYSSGKLRAATFGRGIWQTNVIGKIELNDIFASETDVVEGSTITFSADYQGEASSIEWTFDGGMPNTSSLENPTITYPFEGNFDVSLTIQGFNEETLSKSAFITVAEPLSIGDELSRAVYPNPTTGTFSIEISENNTKIELIDISGRTLLSKLITRAGQEEINISSLPSGLYTLKISNAKGERTGKVLKN